LQFFGRQLQIFHREDSECSKFKFRPKFLKNVKFLAQNSVFLEKNILPQEANFSTGWNFGKGRVGAITPLPLAIRPPVIRTRRENRFAGEGPSETVVSVREEWVRSVSKLKQCAAVVRWNSGNIRHLHNTHAQRFTYTHSHCTVMEINYHNHTYLSYILTRTTILLNYFFKK